MTNGLINPTLQRDEIRNENMILASENELIHDFVYREESEMKDSGVEWIGIIPKDWTKVKLKFLVNYIKGYAFKSELFKNNGLPIVKASDIKNYTVKHGKDFLSEEDSTNFSKVKLEENDLIISTVGSNPDVINSAVGQVAKVPKELNNSYLNQNTVKIIANQNKNLFSDFLFYILISNPYRKYLNLHAHGTANQSSLNIEDMFNFIIAKDLLSEQKKITSFLDKKTVEFDNIISKKEKIITKLEEAKKSLISEVISGKIKIVNGEIISRDKSEMVDSGIEWIGMIPKSWKTTKIKYNTYVKGRIGWQGLRAEEFIDEGPYLVTGTDFIKNKIRWSTCYHISEQRFNEAPPIQLKEGDLLITKDGTIGKIAIAENCPEKAILNSGIFVTRCTNNDYITKYMFYILTSVVFDKYIEITKTGSTIQHLYQETFVNFEYPLTNKHEQTQIFLFLDKKTNEFDTIIAKEKLMIKKIKEAKQSLISEAVTGKIKIL